MVKKLFALASITALTGLVAATAATGCSSTEVVPDDKGGDAGKGDGGKPKPDVDAEPVEPEPDNCYDEGSAKGYPADKVTAEYPGGKCTAAQVDALMAGCFSQGSSNDACKAAIDASPACTECVIGPQEAKDKFDFPALILDDSKAWFSAYACLSVALNKPECAVPVMNSFMCSATACSSCSDGEADACEKEADEGICGSIEVPEACITALNGVKKTDDAYKQCFGDNWEASAKKTINTLCVEGAKKP